VSRKAGVGVTAVDRVGTRDQEDRCLREQIGEAPDIARSRHQVASDQAGKDGDRYSISERWPHVQGVGRAEDHMELPGGVG
jgi:hypothetical protein